MPLTALILLFASGCASVGTSFDATHVESIQVNRTTRAELESGIGKPMSIGFSGDGKKTATWMYTRAKSRPQNFIPIIGWFLGGVDTETKQLMVVFNSDNTVADYNFNDSDSVFSYGF